MRSDFQSKILNLTEHNLKAHSLYSHANPVDRVDGLDDRKKQGWRRILSSVATTESVEEIMMLPLEKAFKDYPEIVRYLVSHKQDETRHHQLLNRYLKNTFDYVKIERTFSDRWIYDRILPRVAKRLESKPLYGLAMLLFFEMYGVGFYKNFKNQAERDGLSGLAEVVKLIEKVELRHMSGLDLLCSYYMSSSGRNGRVTWFESLLLRFCLLILVLDVNMSRWAIHNLEVREHVKMMGLDPHDLTLGAYQAARDVYRKVARKEVLC